MPYNVPKTSKKEVRYLNKDFSSFKSNLIEFAKVYFPNTYNDFNEASPGMMFIEMAAYVGDVLNYYVDNQFRETMLQHAEEKKNIFLQLISAMYLRLRKCLMMKVLIQIYILILKIIGTFGIIVKNIRNYLNI